MRGWGGGGGGGVGGWGGGEGGGGGGVGGGGGWGGRGGWGLECSSQCLKAVRSAPSKKSRYVLGAHDTCFELRSAPY